MNDWKKFKFPSDRPILTQTKLKLVPQAEFECIACGCFQEAQAGSECWFLTMKKRRLCVDCFFEWNALSQWINLGVNPHFKCSM